MTDQFDQVTTRRGRLLVLCFGIFVLSCLGRSTSARPAESGVDAGSLIRQKYDAGMLTFNQMATLEMQALIDPSKLPPEYASAAKTPGGCATPMILELQSKFDELSSENQAMLQSLLDRPSRQASYASPYGFFRLHYDTTGPQAVPTEDADSNGIPDLVDRCAAYLDTTRQAHLGWGYIMPASDGTLGGDSLYDAYFTLISDYGFMAPDGDGPEPWNDGISHLILHNTFEGFPPNDDPQGSEAGTAKVVCAHEFHHAVQRAYDRDEALWFVEMDAVQMEELIYPLVNDNFIYIDEFFTNPWKALTATSDNHLYASFPFGLYMAKKFDTVLFREAWEGAKYDGQVFNALADSLLANYGWTRDSAIAEFWVWNYLTGSRDDGNHYDDAALYPLINIENEYTVFPVDTVQCLCTPQGYGACYVRFRRVLGVNGTLRLQFNGADSTDWAVWVLTTTPTNVHTYTRMPLDPVTKIGTFDVPSFQSYQTVTMIVGNLDEYSSAATFEYGAHIPSGYAVSLEPVTTDSAIYYRSNREWTYRINNPSDKNATYTVSYSDDSGWVSPDNVPLAVPKFGSRDMQIDAHPPLGTPIGHRSNLHVSVVSTADPYVYDEGESAMEIVLQYGDLDLSGTITLADLSIMIDHLFISLSPITPFPEAGDFDCSGTAEATLSDLSRLIDYLFITVDTPPSCNPY